MAETKTTYQREDGERIYGEYDYVEQLEYFDGDDEPVDLVKKTWVLQSSERYQHIPPGWEPPEDD